MARTSALALVASAACWLVGVRGFAVRGLSPSSALAALCPSGLSTTRQPARAQCARRSRGQRTALVMAGAGDEPQPPGPSPGDEPAGPSPEDWRAFRTALIERGIQMTDGQEENGEDKGADKEAGERWGASGELKRSVAPANEKLLMAQNPKLAEEYLRGVWAHETGDAEVGGLVARMPLDFQILHLMRRSEVSSTASPEIELAWGQKLQHYLREQAGKGKGAEARLKEWSGNLQYMYKLAGRLVKEEIETMITAAGGTRIDPDRLSDENRALLAWYVSSVESWQEVVLVLEHEVEGASSSGVVINRPLRRGIDSDLAQMLLRGKWALVPLAFHLKQVNPCVTFRM
jgi:hypothetical protein